MANRKPSTKPNPKTEDLTMQRLPGGGTAYWYKPGEVSPRRERALNVISAYMMPKLRAAMLATNITVAEDSSDAEKLNAALSMQLSREDVEATLEMTETTIITYLKSWSLQDPIPTEIDALLDLPANIYNALGDHANKITSANIVDGYSIDAIEDPESPTGDSGD